MKALSFTESFSILVLSPKIDPPENFDEGSIAKTAIFDPFSIRRIPRDSIKVDLPTPGTPVMPILIDLLLPLKYSKRFSEKIWSSSNDDSISVIAFPKYFLEPD